jgi:hypothetical protein
MDEQPNLREFLNEVSTFTEEEAPSAPAKSAPAQLGSVGEVVEIAGSASMEKKKQEGYF